ncbi:helix-turn-helix domain-containing protein [Ruegeria atlantica]|uniref:helix-turn-helix domain-containing protein n=1 Tax=Ruegeria atlantica TaxID=81569 RepID=UPI00349FF3AC
MPRGQTNIGDIAQRLGVSSRTLQRKLAAKNVSHTQLVQRARNELACMYLAENKTRVSVIASRLGYRDASNFSRAFHRWTGQSPLEWRKKFQTTQPTDQSCSHRGTVVHCARS